MIADLMKAICVTGLECYNRVVISETLLVVSFVQTKLKCNGLGFVFCTNNNNLLINHRITHREM